MFTKLGKELNLKQLPWTYNYKLQGCDQDVTTGMLWYDQMDPNGHFLFGTVMCTDSEPTRIRTMASPILRFPKMLIRPHLDLNMLNMSTVRFSWALSPIHDFFPALSGAGACEDPSY